MQKNGDDLELQISASVKKAEKAIDSLVAKLDVLQTSLTGVSAGGASKAADAFSDMAKQSKAVGKASKTFNSGMEKTNSAMRKTQKSAWSLASAFGKFYASYFLVIRGIKGLWGSIESTTDYIEAFNYFDVAFGKIASEWSQDFERFGYKNAEAYADSFTKRMTDSLGDLSGLTLDSDKGLLTASGTKNLALNIQEITQSASQLASITNSIGLVGEVSLTAADSFTKLAADMSSLFNIDFSSAMKNLQSGLIGQSRALYKYGIDITNATLQTYAYELGLSKAVSEMTQSEKMQLRMLAILDQSKVAWGDLANTINSPSNMIRQFTNNSKEAGMVLGQLFIPMLQKILPVLNGITIAIKNLLVNIASFFGVQLDLSSFGQGYADMEDDIDGVTGSLEDATAAAKKLKTATLGIDELNINAPQEDSGTSGGGVGGGIDLTDQILKATEEYKKIWDAAFAGMENKAQKFAQKVADFFKPLTESLRDFGKGEISFGELLADIASFTVTGLETALTNALEAVNWYSVGISIYDFIKNIDYATIFGKAIDLGKVIFSIIPEITIGTTFSFVDDILPKLLGYDKENAGKFWEQETTGKGLKLNLQAVVEYVVTYAPDALGITEFKNNLARDWNETVDRLKELWKKRSGEIVNMGDWWNKYIAPWFTKERWVKLLSNIPVVFAVTFTSAVNSAIGSINRVISGIESMINGAITGLNTLIELANKIPGIEIEWRLSNVSLPKIKMMEVPKFATGGFPEDGLFMANHNELVGQFSNGRTAVANNDQIIAGIKEGVREVVAEVLAPYLADIAQSNREVAEKDFSVNIGDREIARANARGQRSMGFALITE